MSIDVYGIPNCDTIKKARKWLDAHGIAYVFHDYKKEGADAARLARWVEEAGWQTVLNRRGTTFRKLAEDEREGLDGEKAVAVMAAHPSCIKRPVLEYDGGLLVGFDEAEWSAALV
ncbi:ArsC family reductase [Novosphingobium aquimarinum]|uniref:ArsC family reductase n=1 Tax=Novosphingobium aquimarinum TaxID=2682494 RepID=UPI0012EB44AB|nr:ArsC family reductase [Novosphingobium aquimarinum]